MRTFQQRVLVGFIATLLGIAAGVSIGYLAGREVTLRQAQTRLDQFAKRAVVDGDISTAESRQILAEMNAAPFAYCSEDEVTFFRKLIYQSRFLKEAGRIRNNRISCSTTLGRSTQNEAQLRPDFTQKDGSRIYRDPSMFRVGNETVLAVQIGDSYVVYNPYVAPTPSLPNAHFIVTDRDATTRTLGRLFGDIPQVPVSVLSNEGPSRVGGNLFVTRCSADSTVCMSAYVATSDALRTNSTVQIALTSVGAITGGLLGFLFSLIYRRKQDIEHQLLRAIRRDALRVVYQPIVDIETGKIVEAEALARWTNDDNQPVSPDVFIKVAEERGFVGEITKLVVRHVLQDFGPLLRTRRDFRVNVNIAAPDLADGGFLPMLENSLAGAGVRPQSLTVEITESYTARQQVAKETIMRLRQRGHDVYIDDFGTGYSSLAYLHDLSVDAIKIDKAFTKAIGTDAVTVSILPQILTMAETLGLRVVVEGIETPEQARYFNGARQSVLAQGWLYGHPVSAGEFHKLLQGEAEPSAASETFLDHAAVASAISAA